MIFVYFYWPVTQMTHGSICVAVLSSFTAILKKYLSIIGERKKEIDEKLGRKSTDGMGKRRKEKKERERKQTKTQIICSLTCNITINNKNEILLNRTAN